MKHPFYRGLIEAGCDEAGRGCLAGPVCAAAVILPEKIKIPRIIRDSKVLSPETRKEAAEWVKSHAFAWAVGWASVEEIDRLNILWASIKAMHRALEALTSKPEHVLVDGNRFSPWEKLPYTCIVNGDHHVASIAAASILAKTERDKLMEALHKEYPHYGWLNNKGYATEEHRAAIRLFGLSPYHRSIFVANILRPSLFD
jgi:ribonuclease HII